MSLQLAAQHLASRGRGPDTQLVHMAPNEVAGLHALALAHGGKLTINPDTGLPEAGFLKNILPMLIGAGLTVATGGAAAPWMIGLGMGGLETLRTGDLSKGLMAGLGAYGGAGLGAGLMGAGATTADATASALGVPGAATGAGSQAAMLAAQNQGFGQAGLEALGSSAGYASGAAPVVQSGMQSLGAGAQGLLSEQGRSAALSSMGGGMNAAKYGLAAASPLMQQDPREFPEDKGSGPNPYNYRFIRGEANPFPTPDPTGAGRLYFPNARYERLGLAEGGPVESMSNANALGANTGFPMANIHQGAYAVPYQQPISSSVISGRGDSPVDPYTGEERLAKGGILALAEGGDFAGVQEYIDGSTNAAEVAERERRKDIAASGYGGGSEPAAPTGWSLMSPAEQAAFYADNPTMAAITQAGQALFGMTTLGQLQAALDPGLVASQSMIAKGVDPASMTAQAIANAAMAQNADNQAVDAANAGLAVADAVGMSGMGTGTVGLGEGTGGVTAADGVGSSGMGGGTAGGDGGPSGDGSGGEARGGLMPSRRYRMANGGMFPTYATGGISHLGDYSDGGRLLRGPGDGVSDSIPATIANKRPARLADGEFVIPARIVSELGNGSTDAGARKLYAMMDRIQKNRSKTVGKGKVAVNSKAERMMPA